ncbi:MAG: hypothetical protein ACE15F_00110 [bacterium]
MKARWLFIPVFVTLILIPGSNSFSREEPEPQIFLLMRDDVKVGQEEAYIAAAKEINEMFKQGNWPYASLAFRYLSSFYYAMPIEGFAALDKGMEAFQKVEQAVGSEKFKALMTQNAENILSSSTMIIVSHPELSYMPDEAVFEFDIMKSFNVYVVTYYFKPEAGFEIPGIFKEALALHKSKKSRLDYFVYEVLFGPDTPAYMVAIQTQDLPQFLEENPKDMALLGPEYAAFLKKNAPLVRRIEEMMHVEFLPDLGYFPEGK